MAETRPRRPNTDFIKRNRGGQKPEAPWQDEGLNSCPSSKGRPRRGCSVAPACPSPAPQSCSPGTRCTEQGWCPGGALGACRLFCMQGMGAENQGSRVLLLLQCCSQGERSWAGLSPRFASVLGLNGGVHRLGNAQPRCEGRKGEWENPPGAHPRFPPRASKEQTPTYPREKEGIDILVCKTGCEGYICATLKPGRNRGRAEAGSWGCPRVPPSPRGLPSPAAPLPPRSVNT